MLLLAIRGFNQQHFDTQEAGVPNNILIFFISLTLNRRGLHYKQHSYYQTSKPQFYDYLFCYYWCFLVPSIFIQILLSYHIIATNTLRFEWLILQFFVVCSLSVGNVIHWIWHLSAPILLLLMIKVAQKNNVCLFDSCPSFEWKYVTGSPWSNYEPFTPLNFRIVFDANLHFVRLSHLFIRSSIKL